MNIKWSLVLLLLVSMGLGGCWHDDADPAAADEKKVETDLNPTGEVDADTDTSPETDAEPEVVTTDTDGDGLSDEDEAKYGTKPDSQDSDNDGLTDPEEILTYLTNPLVSDTDGDGYSDFEEIVQLSFDPNSNNYLFNPLIADVPKLDVKITSTPDLSMVYSTSTETNQSVGTERSNSTSSAKTTSWTDSQSHSIEETHSGGFEIGLEKEFGIGKAGVKASLNLHYEYSHAKTNSSTWETSAEQSTENSLALAQMQSIESSEGVTVNSGKIQTSITLTNSGSIAYQLDGISLSAYIQDPKDPFQVKPVGTLSFSGGSGFPITLKDGVPTAPLVFSDVDVNIDVVKGLLKDSSKLIFSPVLGNLTGVGSLTGSGDFNLGLASTNINARTAQIIIDYGFERASESYRVATNLDQKNPGITAKQIFSDVLKLPYSTGVASWNYGNSQTPEVLNTFTGITQVRTTSTDADNTAYWIVTHTHKVNNGADEVTDYYNLIFEDYDFDNIVINKGDVLHLTRIQDADRDGLGTRTEYLLGTDPESADTDGDGLADSTEVNGWDITFNNVQGVRVYSNPLVKDTDGDGEEDAAEYVAGTHPDFVVNNPPIIDLFSLTVDGVTATLSMDVSDGEDFVDFVEIDWGDGSTVEKLTDGPYTSVLLTHNYPAIGSYEVDVKVYDSSALFTLKTDSVTTTTPTNGLILHLPMDGVISDATGNYTITEVMGRTNSTAATATTDRHGNVSGALSLGPNRVMTDRGLKTEGGDRLFASGNFTIALWMIAGSNSGGSWGFAGPLLNQSQTFPDSVKLRSSDRQIRFGLFTNSIGGSTLPNSPTWSFIVVTSERNGSNINSTLYMDGINIAEKMFAVDTTPISQDCPFYVGFHEGLTSSGISDGCGYEFKAIGTAIFHSLFADDVRVFNRPISAGEVKALYHENGYMQ